MIFSQRYTDRAAIMRPKTGTLNAGGRSTYEQLKDDEESPLFLRCRLEERVRVVLDDRGQQRQGDASLVYRHGEDSTVEDGDLLVVNGQVYEIIGTESQRLPFGYGTHSRLTLAKSKLAVPEVVG